MRLKCLACEALARVVYHCAAVSPHTVDVELLKLGLHNDPPDLRKRLQGALDGVSDEEYDHVVMAYGLCGQAIAGLTARHVPVTLPRAHDCITLFLGGRQRYQEQFEQYPGTYWYAADYIERGGPGVSPTMSLGGASEDELTKTYEQFVATYGEENAAYLMETMGAWKENYNRAAFIDFRLGDPSLTQRRAREEAERRGWTFDRLDGDIVLIRKLLEGTWDEDFLTVPPGQRVAESYDADVFGARE